MPRRITRRRTVPDPGSSAVEFALMVAAMAAMILAVVLGVGRVVGNAFFHGCGEISSEVAAGGGCIAPGAPDAPAAGAGTNAKTSQAPVVPADSEQGVDGGQPAPGTNDLGTVSDDM